MPDDLSYCHCHCHALTVCLQLGNELTPTQVKDIPSHVTWPSETSALYTVCMTDPDAPSRQTPKYREWHHWLVVNIPNNEIAKGDILSEYVGSGPPKGITNVCHLC